MVVFYYTLNIDLAHKSWVIAASGVVLLIVRWIAGRFKLEEWPMKKIVFWVHTFLVLAPSIT